MVHLSLGNAPGRSGCGRCVERSVSDHPPNPSPAAAQLEDLPGEVVHSSGVELEPAGEGGWRSECLGNARRDRASLIFRQRSSTTFCSGAILEDQTEGLM